MNTLTALSPERAPDARLLPAVWKLLLLRARITFNSFRNAKLRRKIGTIIVWLLVLAFAVFLVTMSWLLLKFMRSPELTQYLEIDPASLLAAIPVLILAGLFLGILLTSFGALLQALYLSGDMDFLLATPVPIRAVFVAKLLQAVLPNFALVSLFGLPVLFGLGFSGGYNILYYPLVLLTMIALALAAAGLSSLLVMLVARILPPRRAAEILGFLGAIIGFTCSQMGNLSNSFSDEMGISGAQVSGLLLRANTPWLPLNWAGQGLIALGEGRWLTGLLLVGLTLGLSTAAFWFALVTAERWYYSGWAGMQVIERRKKPIRTHQSSAAEQENIISRLTRLLPAPVWGIVWKDFLTLRRDLRSLSQLITPLIMGVIYTLISFRGGGEPPVGRGEAPTWFMDALGLMMSYSSVGMSLFVGWVLLSRLAGLGFSHEGKNYWMVKTSPVSTRHLLTAKFLVAYLPGLGLGLVFLVVIAFLQNMTLTGFLYSLVIVVMCLAGLTGIQLAFGVLGANFTWDDPRKMNAGGMGCLGQLLTIACLPVAFGLFIGPLGLAGLFNVAPMYGYLAGLAIGSSVAIGCACLPLWLARKRVERLDEI